MGVKVLQKYSPVLNFYYKIEEINAHTYYVISYQKICLSKIRTIGELINITEN